MRKAIALLIVFLLVGHCVSRLGWVAWYEHNKEWIASEFCINKDKPELDCKGSCCLKEKLENTEPAHTPSGAPVKESTEISLVYLLPQTLNLLNCRQEKKGLSFGIPEDSTNKIITSIFHPPCFS